MNLSITIPGLPRMANGSYGSWQARAKERRTWKAKVAKALVGLAPEKPFERIRVRFTRLSSVEPDFDGLVHGFKPVRDALVKFGFVIDDKNRNMLAEYAWEHAPRGHGAIRVELSAPVADTETQTAREPRPA